MARIAASERLRRELDEIVAGAVRSWTRSRRSAGSAHGYSAAGARGGADRLPRPGALRAARRADCGPQRLRAGAGEDDSGAA